MKVVEIILKSWKRVSTLTGSGMLAFYLASCGEAGNSTAPAYGAPLQTVGERANTKRAVASAPEERPGLATGWGHNVRSTMGYTEFHRNAKPSDIAMIRYNDSKGAKAMGASSNYWNRSGMQAVKGGLVSWGVKSRGRLLKNQIWKGERFVTGSNGKTYSLMVKNLCESRLEVVLTVDGLDVQDGKKGSLKKRGYIVKSGQTLEVKGFRRSTNTVAAFKFSTVSDSYANLRHGDTRNVGVLGLGVFTEKGVNPWQERVQRQTVRAFAEKPLYRAKTTTD